MINHIIISLILPFMVISSPNIPENRVIAQNNTIQQTSTIPSVIPLKEEVVSLDKAQIKEIIYEYGWDSDLMYEIAKCESQLSPTAHNFSHETRDNSIGILQINLYGELANERPDPQWLKNPANNISYAYTLWKQQGYGAWRNCYNKVKGIELVNK